MIQQLIYERFGVYSNVFYIAQLLKNLGFSYQKAAFVSDHLNEGKRSEWRTTTWPQIQQPPRSTRRNTLPVKLVDGSRLMCHKHLACALVEQMEIGKPSSGPDLVLHHPPWGTLT